MKLAPVVRAAEDRGHEALVIHSGQHYDHAMDGVFFDELGLAPPRHNLRVGSASHGAQTGRMLEGIERALLAERPEAVLVQGDTNTTVAGALAAVKLHVRAGHVEAGLRSRDRSMPEEINRVLADHAADDLFPPTLAARANLRAEGLDGTVTGNTIVDAVIAHRALAEERSDALDRLSLSGNGFALLTAHRQENTDDPVRFQGILDGAARVAKEIGAPTIYPVHPRARRRIAEHGLATDGLRLVEPLGFLDFLRLESSARLVITDSGGVQEESCILRVPCVTVRDNTERPETVDVGANALAGADPEAIVRAAVDVLSRPRTWANPFGDGRAGRRIVELLEDSAR